MRIRSNVVGGPAESVRHHRAIHSDAADVGAGLLVSKHGRGHQSMNGFLVGTPDGDSLLSNLGFEVLSVKTFVDHHLPLFQRLSHLKQQLFGRDGLDEIGGSAPRQRGNRRRRLAERREHDDFGIARGGLDLRQQLETGTAGERHVERHQSDRTVLENGPSLLGVASLKTRIAGPLQPPDQQAAHCRFVVDDQQRRRARAIRAAARRFPRLAALARPVAHDPSHQIVTPRRKFRAGRAGDGHAARVKAPPFFAEDNRRRRQTGYGGGIPAAATADNGRCPFNSFEQQV